MAGEKTARKPTAVLLKGSKASGVSPFSKGSTGESVPVKGYVHRSAITPRPDPRAALAVWEVLWSPWRQATEQLCFSHGPLVLFSHLSIMGGDSV